MFAFKTQGINRNRVRAICSPLFVIWLSSKRFRSRHPAEWFNKMILVMVHSGKLYHATTERSRDFRMFATILSRSVGTRLLQLNKFAEKEMPKRASGRRSRTLSLARGIHTAGISRWTRWKKRSIHESTAGGGSSVEVSKVARRSAGGLGITEEAIPVITIGHSDTRSSSPISRGHSAGAPCKMGFSTCARAATIRRKCISEIAATAGVPYSVFFFPSFFPFQARIPNPGPPSSPVLPIAFSVLSVIYFRNEESPEYLRWIYSRRSYGFRSCFYECRNDLNVLRVVKHKGNFSKVFNRFLYETYERWKSNYRLSQTESEISGNDKMTQKHNLRR